jgi:hypothetical protein
MGLLNTLGEFSHRLFASGETSVRTPSHRPGADRAAYRGRGKIDDPNTPAFSCTSPAPPNFADSSSVPDNVAGLGIPGYEINEVFPLIIRIPVIYTPLAQVIKNKMGVGSLLPLPHPKNCRVWPFEQWARSGPVRPYSWVMDQQSCLVFDRCE